MHQATIWQIIVRQQIAKRPQTFQKSQSRNKSPTTILSSTINSRHSISKAGVHSSKSRTYSQSYQFIFHLHSIIIIYFISKKQHINQRKANTKKLLKL